MTEASFFISDTAGSNGWNPLESDRDAQSLIERLIALGFEAIVGYFAKSTCVEIQQWRDRRNEGVPGDPHAHRSRETVVGRSGSSRLRTIVEACVEAASLSQASLHPAQNSTTAQ